MTAKSAGSATAARQGTRIRKHSVMVHGHQTSVSLEDAFWQALKDIADRQGRPVAALIAEVDQARDGNLSSALRVFVLDAVKMHGD
ncbi:MAG: ribbon-helix-helix domain-containing protein [Proteobacteria bacterium]|nr:ribbon-helix-helix domain-containing protein [Pseudomonadota bacterium]